MTDHTTTENRTATTAWITWAILLAILLCAAAIRWRLLDVPLERDEGEYAYAGQLILDGVPPYREAYNMKLPGIYAAYAAVLAVFGETQRGIHLGLLVVNSVTILLVFSLARQLADDFTGLVAAACFGLLSVGLAVQGVFANAEHFVLPPAIAGLILLERAVASDRKWALVISGLLLGLAFVVKQHGAAFVAGGGVYLVAALLRERGWREVLVRGLLFGLAAASPYLLTCLIMAALGVFESFWFWTFEYALAYASQRPLSAAPILLFGPIDMLVLTAPLLWMLAIVGATSLIWDSTTRRNSTFLVLFAIFSFLSVCPGFYFRPHYFLLAMPAAAVFMALGARFAATLASSTESRRGYVVAAVLVMACLTDGAVRQRHYLFQWSPDRVSMLTYGTRLFRDSVEIAQYIQQHTSKSDRTAILGSEPQLLFYADRRSATGYIYTYALMESQPYALDMQREMIREIEESNPKLLVFINAAHSWLAEPDSPQEIFRWFDEYRRQHQLAAIFDLDRNPPRKLVGKSLAELQKRPQESVEIYLRRDND